MGERGRRRAVMRARGWLRSTDGGGCGRGREAGTESKTGRGQRRGEPDIQSTKSLDLDGGVGGSGSWRTARSPRPGIGGGGMGKPRSNPEADSNPDPTSLKPYPPRALRPPPSLRPAARASSARHRPAARPSAVAPPPPCPLWAGPAPSRPVSRPRGGWGMPGEGDRTWTAGVCVCARAQGVRVWCGPFAPPPGVPGARSPPPLQLGAPGGREGAGLAEAQLGEGSGGGGGGRSPLPPPTRRPRAGSDPAQAWYGMVA